MRGEDPMICEACGNDYDKAFQIIGGDRAWPSTASSAPFRRSLRRAAIVAAGSSVMASSPTASSIAALRQAEGRGVAAGPNGALTRRIECMPSALIPNHGQET
jgi:hypothetical protein